MSEEHQNVPIQEINGHPQDCQCFYCRFDVMVPGGGPE